MALGGALGLVLVARDAVELFVADMAQGDIPLCFTWQAWHHLIWGFCHLTCQTKLCGAFVFDSVFWAPPPSPALSCSMSHPALFCVASVALMALGSALGPVFSCP